MKRYSGRCSKKYLASQYTQMAVFGQTKAILRLEITKADELPQQ
ncbi:MULTISPECIES: hypothetical protein [unclassified Coleofasciculus]|jgi:hypothetical protein|nr:MULTISPECIES: hypothetical protein [unclassified Coleofasciculus]